MFDGLEIVRKNKQWEVEGEGESSKHFAEDFYVVVGVVIIFSLISRSKRPQI